MDYYSEYNMMLMTTFSAAVVNLIESDKHAKARHVSPVSWDDSHDVSERLSPGRAVYQHVGKKKVHATETDLSLLSGLV